MLAPAAVCALPLTLHYMRVLYARDVCHVTGRGVCHVRGQDLAPCCAQEAESHNQLSDTRKPPRTPSRCATAKLPVNLLLST